MRTLKAGVAAAIVVSMLVGPLAAAGRQNGVISGSARAEVKEPYTDYIVRARDVQTNQIVQHTSLDANAEFAVSNLNPGTYLVELVKNAAPNGQGGKVICTAGPFTLQESNSQVDLMIKRGADIQCRRPVAAWWLLGAAAAAGIGAGIAAGGDPASPSQ